MNINTDSIIPFILMWGIPTFMIVRGYLKMSNTDKKLAINDFKSSRFTFTIGFLVLGSFISHLGFLLDISIIRLIGIIFLALGGTVSTLYMWNKSRIKSVLMIMLITLFLWYQLS